MSPRAFIVWLLLRMYPAAWRREFGAEFEELLHRGPLSFPVILNVGAGALGERVLHMYRRMTGGGEMADRAFRARYDRLTTVISGVVLVVLAAVPVLLIQSGWGAVAAGLLSAAVIALSFAFSPRGYEISGGDFRIKRLAGDVVFPLNGLRFVRAATPADFWGSVRLWGSGGFFGYYGWFWSSALGRSKWYVTNRDNAVIVANGDQLILVSPEERDEFVAAISNGDPDISPTNELPPRAGMGSQLFVGLGIGGAALGVVAASLLYAPGPPPLELTRESLVIHSLFFGMTVPASSVDAANVRVVDLGTEPGWKPVSRTGGFGNANYRAGNFRTANGRAVKLFTAGAPRLVLLPPLQADGKPVLLDTADPDQFVSRVRQQWGGQSPLP